MAILPGETALRAKLPGPILRRSSLRYALQHPWQTWLSFLGIMLGVMMVVAVDLANNSARQAFSLSVAAVSGAISHQIAGGSEGIPDSVYTGLRTQLGIRRSAPALSGQLRSQDYSFTLIGLDPLSEAVLQRGRPGLARFNSLGGAFSTALTRSDAVLLSERSAAQLDLQVGETVSVLSPAGPMDLYLAGIFPSDNPAATEGLMFTDIGVAQRLLNRNGRLDSIDLIISEGQARQIREWLPPQFALVETASRDDSLQQMTQAFHVNLLAMSLLSLLVAALLIYNTMTLSVLQRQHSLGILRCQGVSSREIYTVILGEAAVLGTVASIAGVISGISLGRFLVTLVTRTIDDLYFNLNVTSFLFNPWSVFGGAGLGLGVTLLAAALPAWHAVQSKPVTLQHRAVKDRSFQAYIPYMLVLGLVLMATGVVILIPQRGTLTAGFVALMLVIFGFCFLVPGFMAAVLSLVLKALGSRLRISSRMALRGIRQGISRTGLAVAALTVALSVTVGVGIMVSSFRDTVQLWLTQSLPGDIQVASAAGSQQNIAPTLAAQIAQLPGVADVEGAVQKRVETRVGPLRLLAATMEGGEGFYIKQGEAAQLAAWSRGEGILVSEPLAYLQNLTPGGTLQIFTDRGPQEFPIVGIFYDYTSSLGLVGMHESLYEQWWNDTGLTRLSVTLEADAAGRDQVMVRLRELLASLGDYQAVANNEIRRITLTIFDRTFAITNVLRLLAIVVAFVGVLSALMALQLERLKEFAILRATGMTPAQVAGLILLQTAVMGLFAGLLALPLGLLMSDILINVINQRSFGWSMQQLLPLGVLAEGLILALVAALLAGLYPAFRAASIRPARALREE